jgi:hypothetical protein
MAVTGSVHHIGRQTVEFTFPHKEGANDFKEMMGHIQESVLMPIIDTVLNDTFPDEGEIHFIDRIELNLGVLSENDLYDDGKSKIAATIKEKLSEWFIREGRGAMESGTERAFTQRQHDDDRPSEQSRLDAVFLVLTCFLESGIVPWWQNHVIAGPIEDLFLETMIDHRIRTVSFLCEKIANPLVRQRLAAQFSHSTLLKAAELIISRNVMMNDEIATELWTIVRSMKWRKPLPSGISVIFWDTFFTVAHQTGIPQGLGVSRDQFIEVFLSLLDQFVKKAHMVQPEDNTPHILLMKPAFFPSHHELSIAVQPSRHQTEQTGITKITRPLTSHSEPINQASVLEEKRTNELLGTILVENSGIVLLWPHLKRFFYTLNLVKNGAFVDDGAAVKAIHLLQYLVTSKANHPEHLLILNKILCGWDVLKPIPKRVSLGKKVKQEGEILLKAVIAQWATLGNTSTSAFRQSFLNRQGTLIEEEQGWTLRVERKAYDVLLERLPWGFGMIRLSWMTKMVVVEW